MECSIRNNDDTLYWYNITFRFLLAISSVAAEKGYLDCVEKEGGGLLLSLDDIQ